MNKKNKILIFHPYFRFGGVERTNLRLSKIFLQNDYEVEIITFKYTYELKSEIDEIGIKIVDLSVSRAVSSIKPLIRYIKTQISDYNIILLSNQNYVNIMSIFVKLYFKNKIKLIMTERNHPIELTLKDEKIKNKIILFLMKHLYKYSDKIVTISSTMQKDIEKITNTKVDLIFNPSYDESIIPMSEEKIIHPFFNENNKVIVSVGRMEKQKNYMMLLKAFRAVHKQLPSIKLLIIGEGSQRNMLQKYIDENNLLNSVELIGYKSNPFPYIKKSNLFILTSLWEGFGNVLVEAIILDTPVVSTNCLSGPNDILLDGKGGDLIKVDDIEALSKSIIKNLQDKKYTFELLKNAKIGCERFKLENIAKEYIKLFKEMRNER